MIQKLKVQEHLHRTVIYSLPDPPPTSRTVFSPWFASKHLGCYCCTKTSLIAVPCRHLAISVSFKSCSVVERNSSFTLTNHSSKTLGSAASALALVKCCGFLLHKFWVKFKKLDHHSFPGTPDFPNELDFPTYTKCSCITVLT